MVKPYQTSKAWPSCLRAEQIRVKFHIDRSVNQLEEIYRLFCLEAKSEDELEFFSTDKCFNFFFLCVEAHRNDEIFQ